MPDLPISSLPVATTLGDGDLSPWVVSGTTSRVSWAALAAMIQSVVPAEIPSGTVMVFFQAAAPTGWTQVVTQTDKVLRVVSGTGAGTGGSWTISGISVDSHVLDISQIPAHTHSKGTTSTSGGAGPAAGQGGGADATGSTGGGLGHNHNLTIGSAWRPAYIDVIIASKD